MSSLPLIYRVLIYVTLYVIAPPKPVGLAVHYNVQWSTQVTTVVIMTHRHSYMWVQYHCSNNLKSRTLTSEEMGPNYRGFNQHCSTVICTRGHAE